MDLMNHLKKTFYVSLATLTLLGAGASSISPVVNAKGRHARTHRVVRLHRHTRRNKKARRRRARKISRIRMRNRRIRSHKAKLSKRTHKAHRHMYRMAKRTKHMRRTRRVRLLSTKKNKRHGHRFSKKLFGKTYHSASAYDNALLNGEVQGTIEDVLANGKVIYANENSNLDTSLHTIAPKPKHALLSMNRSKSNSNVSDNEVVNRTIQDINNARIANGLNPYRVSSVLSQIAQARSQQLQSRFSHYDANGNFAGKAVAEEQGDGNLGSHIAENIAKSNGTNSNKIADRTTNNMLNHDQRYNNGHRHILLSNSNGQNPDEYGYIQMGVGSTTTPQGGTTIAEEFD